MANALKTLFTDIAGAIRETLPDEGKMPPSSFPNKIREAVAAGGGSEDICYVTFMSEDGSIEYGKKSVIYGDDCMEPVSHGLFSKPTKNPTNTVVYNHSGWSMTAGGSASFSALANVTEDRVVYAAYAEAVRYYTVRFFDGDELKNTLEVTYNGFADYSLTKKGYQFVGWEPSNNNITADTDCYAQWETAVTFANATWAQIAEISESGKAPTTFAVGDSKTLTFNGESIEIEIVGFNHDDLADGSGKAGISMICKTLSSFTVQNANMTNFNTSISDKLLPKLGSDVQSVIKTVKKKCDSANTSGTSVTPMTSSVKVWLPSSTELNIPGSEFTSESSSNIPKYISTLGSPYTMYSSSMCPMSKYGSGKNWIMRTHFRNGSLCPLGLSYSSSIGYNYTFFTSGGLLSCLLPFGFCV